KSLEHDLLDALSHLRVVAVARHIYEAGVEAVIGIAPRQQANGAPLVQIHHTAGDPDQVIDACLEELIARVGLQHVEDGLAVVAVRVEPEILDDAIDLARSEERRVGKECRSRWSPY